MLAQLPISRSKFIRLIGAGCVAACLAAAGLSDLARAQTVTGRANLATWMSNGPFGGVVNDLTVDPHDPDVVYAGTRGGVFKSVDGGERWFGSNSGLTNVAITSVEVDPSDPNLVLAGSHEGLFRSEDAGAMWSEVAQDPARPYFHDTFYEVDFSPTGPTIFALGGYDIYRSDDRGRTWSVVYHQEPATLATLTIAPDGQTIYVGGQNGLLVSTDQGLTWRQLPGPDVWVNSVAVDPRDPAVVYAVASSGLYKSHDGGTTWASLLPPEIYAYEVELAPGAPGTVYVVGQVTYGPNRVALYVARSDDAGATWAVETRMPSDSLRRATLAIDQRSPAQVYVGVGGRGVLKSSDGASTFTQKVQGMTAASPEAVAVDPNDPAVIYASLTSGDAFRSEDAGESWTLIPSGPGSDDPYLTSYISHFVVGADSTVYAAGGSGDVYSTEARVFKSTDRGAHWVAASDGLPSDHRVSDLIAAEPGVLVVGLTRQMTSNEGGIYRSTDGGSNWVDISPTRMATRALAYDALSGTLYALVGRGDSPFQSSLYSSRDGGKEWLPHVLPPNLHDPGTISVGPTGQVFLGSSGATQIGVSHDLGVTWVPIQIANNRSGQINDIAQDPLDPTQIFVATGWGGIWISNTAGALWRQMVPGVFGVDARTLVFGPPTSGLTELPDLSDRPLYAAISGSSDSGVWQVYPRPHPRKQPTIEGGRRPGKTLRCLRNSWSRADAFSYRWLRDGALVRRPSEPRYAITRADRGHSISCRVIARGPGGTNTRTSGAVKVRR